MGELTRIGDIRRRTAAAAREPLWRNLLGEQLRERRLDQGRTLTETADAAGMSPQYLSEIERGRKEPSSEMIAAIARALGTSLLDLTWQVADELRRSQVVALRTAQAPAAPQRATRAEGTVRLALAA
ncbi:helix-turn-helix domain-containing protein [Georgenia alba]|uniref:Helix-turn-helix domain-containing protein n=1 Tax=Georgenia alba TaxID=2233858 RepID=A0ABW2Q2P7_9MICO